MEIKIDTFKDAVKVTRDDTMLHMLEILVKKKPFQDFLHPLLSNVT